jgi:hypothetical protein
MAAVKTLIRTGDETERKHFLSERQLRAEEEMRKEQLQRERLGDLADEEIPQAFLDMMELAGAGQGTSVKQESWGEDGNEAEAAVAEVASDDGDSQWADVQDSAGEDWTPKQPASSVGGSAAQSEDLRKAEDAIFKTRKPAIFTSDAARSPRPPTLHGSKPGGGNER